MSQKWNQQPRLWKVWRGIKKRCYQRGHSSYADYGGRGIGMCDEWRRSYVAFREWALAHGYDEGLSIDRVNSKLGYEPDNCRWVPWLDNVTASGRLLTVWGETKSCSAWTRDSRCFIAQPTLFQRLKKGWSPEDAVATPPNQKPLSTQQKEIAFALVNAYNTLSPIGGSVDHESRRLLPRLDPEAG